MQSAYPFAVVVESTRDTPQTIWDARFSVRSNILGLYESKATVLRMKLRSPLHAGGNMARFKTWKEARKTELQD